MNYGFNLELEKRSQSLEDWKFGAGELPDIAEIPEGEREKYLPKGERQNIGEEKKDCASRSVLNLLETKFNYCIKNHKFSLANEIWLKEKGYNPYNI